MPAPAPSPAQPEAAAARALLAERIGRIAGAEAASSWTDATISALLDAVKAHKGVVDDGDVCLLSDIRAAFRAAGIARLGAREAAVKAMQAHLYPNKPPKREDEAALSKEFLRLAQAGLLIEARQLLQGRPRLLSARSTSKGYSAMHYAAMAGALPMLDWLAEQGLSPDTMSAPADGSEQVTPAQVAMEYKRDDAVTALASLGEGHGFLKAMPANAATAPATASASANASANAATAPAAASASTPVTEHARLRAAARAGSAAAAAILLRRHPDLARCPQVADSPHGALMAAARGGHSGVLLELLQCGAAEVPIPEGAPTPLQAAVGAGQAEAASLLHGVEAALRVLKLGSGVLSAAVAPDEDHAPGRDGGGSGGDGAAAPNAAPPAGAQPAGSPPPLSHPLLALAADCKVSRSRIVLMDAWEPLLAFSHGAPGFETSLFRWIESSLGLPIWLPLSHIAYDQLTQGALRAIDSYSSASQRQAVMPLATGSADALKKMTQVLLAAHTPSDVEPRTVAGLTALLGAPVVSAHWDRMPPPTRTWLSRLLFFLPAVPWGRHGWKQTDAARAAAAPPPESGGPPQAVLELELLCLELLTMARPMHALFDDDTEGGRKASARNSVLPYQPHAPDSCPYPPVATSRGSGDGGADGGGSSASGPRGGGIGHSHSAVLLLLAPVRPQDVAAIFPQCLLLNGGGIGSEAREVFGSRLATRLLLQRSHPAANPRWVVVPAVYSPHLAVGVLSRLGGPRSVLLRHPHAARWGPHQGGELAISAGDLDDALRLIFSKVTPPAQGSGGAPGWIPPKRVVAAVEASRLVPGFGPPVPGADTAGGADAFGVLLVEALVPSTALPQDGKKGWFDPTFRAYVASAPALQGGATLLSAKPGAAAEVSGQVAPTEDSHAAAGTGACRERAAAGSEPAKGGTRGERAGPPRPPGVVVGGACRFPSHPLSAAVSTLGHFQHVPTPPHTAVGLGQSMAAAAFAPSRFDAAAVCAALGANPTSLRQLLTILLTEPDPVMHLAAMAVMANAAAGVRQVHHDPDALVHAQRELLGQPSHSNATLWPEHLPLLHRLLAPTYAQAHGAAMTRLVQKRLLIDVILPDFSAVAANARRRPDSEVAALHHSLESSPFDEIRRFARDVRAGYAQMADEGATAAGAPVADVEHLRELVEMLEGM